MRTVDELHKERFAASEPDLHRRFRPTKSVLSISESWKSLTLVELSEAVDE